MTFEQALAWLDARGGRWAARASEQSCAVEVTLGPRQVRSTASRLDAGSVRSALVEAVQTLQGPTSVVS